MDAALRLRCRNALDAMNTALVSEAAENRGSGNAENDFTKAPEIGGTGLQLLDLQAKGIGIPAIHPIQVGGKKRGLGAARAGADFHDGITVLVGFRREERDLNGALESRHLGLQAGDFLFRERRHFLVLACSQFPVFDNLAGGFFKAAPNFEQLSGGSMLAENLPRALGIVEEVGRGDLALQLLETSPLALDQRFKIHR